MSRGIDLAVLDVRTLVPHAGSMCLWQRVLSFDDTHVRMQTMSHRDGHNPLRSGGLLRAVHLCEYGAQAMAAHGGLLAGVGNTPRAGRLVSLRGVQLHVARIDDLPDALVGEATLLLAGADSQQYAFRILHADRVLAEGNAAVMLQGQET